MESKEKALVPLAEVKELANAVASSGLFTAFKNQQQALVLMMIAQAEGCHPIQATQRYDVIQGKPAKKADAMLADFQQRGGKVAWLTYTDEAVEAEFMASGMAKPCKVCWTYQMAVDAGLTGKPIWKQYKRQMLKARVISEGIRISDPGVVAGLYTPEEVQDFDDDKPAKMSKTLYRGEQSQHREVAASEPLDAEIVHPTPSPATLPSEPKEPSGAEASREQVKALCASMGEAGIKDRDEVLAWCKKITGRTELASRSKLTKDECSKCIEAAKAISMAPKEREPGEEG